MAINLANLTSLAAEFTHDQAPEAAAEVAREVLGIQTLETRKSDRLDFHEISVWQLKEALQAAFSRGAETALQAAEAEEENDEYARLAAKHAQEAPDASHPATPTADSDHSERAEWAATIAARNPALAARLAACLMMQGADLDGGKPNEEQTQAFADEASRDWTPGILAYAAAAHTKA